MLVRLYIHSEGSREMAAWRTKIDGALTVPHHGRTEIVNAICRIVFLGHLDKGGMAEASADFEADLVGGRLHQADILWRAAPKRAAALSRRHTLNLGTRTLDGLHVGCAMELRLRHFLIFNRRRQS